MIEFHFKNLEESELAKDIVQVKLKALYEADDHLGQHKLTVTLSRHFNDVKSQPDLFIVNLLVYGEKYGGLSLEKSATSMYSAVDDLSLVLLKELKKRTTVKAVGKIKN